METGASIQELDVVALTADLPAEGLVRGQVGTIVHVYSPGVYEVEFVDAAGRTYGLATVEAGNLLPLHHQPLTAADAERRSRRPGT
jgi:hypothetical protein